MISEGLTKAKSPGGDFAAHCSWDLNQNPKGILLFFPNKSQIIKSYILLKINFHDGLILLAMGSKDVNKFNPDQRVDLIEYLIKIIEIKINQLK